MAHTPGPWKLIWHGDEKYPFPLSVHTEDDSGWVARDGTVSSEDNARLIAAAPALLEALMRAETWLMRITDEVLDGEGTRPDYTATCEAVRAAIAAARGE